MMKWIDRKIADGVHSRIIEKSKPLGMSALAYQLGLYQAIIDTLPDTPENIKHLESFINKPAQKIERCL